MSFPRKQWDQEGAGRLTRACQFWPVCADWVIVCPSHAPLVKTSNAQDDPANGFARFQCPMRVADAFKRNHAVDVSAQGATVDHVGDLGEYLTLSRWPRVNRAAGSSVLEFNNQLRVEGGPLSRISAGVGYHPGLIDVVVDVMVDVTVHPQ